MSQTARTRSAPTGRSSGSGCGQPSAGLPIEPVAGPTVALGADGTSLEEGTTHHGGASAEDFRACFKARTFRCSGLLAAPRRSGAAETARSPRFPVHPSHRRQSADGRGTWRIAIERIHGAVSCQALDDTERFHACRSALSWRQQRLALSCCIDDPLRGRVSALTDPPRPTSPSAPDSAMRTLKTLRHGRKRSSRPLSNPRWRPGEVFSGTTVVSRIIDCGVVSMLDARVMVDLTGSNWVV